MVPSAPDGWSRTRLGEVIGVQGGFAFKSKTFSDVGLPIVRMSNLKSGRLSLQEAARVPPAIVGALDKFQLSVGDLLLGLSGSLENFAVVQDEDTPCYLNQRVGRFILHDKERLSYSLLRHLIQSRYFRERIASLAAGAAQLNISPKQIESLEFNIGPLPEQKKIAEILGSVDEAIQKTQAVISQTERVKKGLLQTLLTRGMPGRHTRFKKTEIGEIPADWEVVPLEALAGKDGLQTGPFGSQLKASEYTPQGVPVVMPKDLSDGYITSATVARIPQARTELLSKHRVFEGDILFGRRGDIGRCAIVRPDEAGWICGTGCLRARVEQENIIPSFLIIHLMRPEIKAWLTKHAVGQTMLNLNTKILGRTPVTVPPPCEQRQIISILESVDYLRRAEESALAAARILKRGLMNDLLTGKVRVSA